MSGSEWTDPRPMSPHLQVWKWHWTMAASIFHRVTGVGNYIGAFLVSAWVIAIAAGPETYATVEGIMLHPVGQILLFFWLASVLFHLVNGIRHMLWDGPKVGFDPKVASGWSVFNFAISILAAATIWSLATNLF
ncbi:succinate dehydrogenase, cytochrome b556 subunit [Henriciella pelagia]|jgi:succinate dehydrogenase / fumarate reductase, cytochrome b subunit|uniref:Succinate dehydrogenase cytochrome b556 subunit n=1 Tax=Henriciella pelagia TaxID=1977912 RepID=A0ABQ1JQT3_9PROT|nr:succinate dehydrogenase, cytochrome b556 subunit [Henriciella pelagia]GGB72350.1 succinate dehydrogenase, cytochrome b556 subunit [Henriciella pelagia]